MTERIYFSSDQLSIEAIVLDCVKGAQGYEVILDRTVFHPQGGGQPSDVGFMDALPVAKVLLKDGKLVHYSDALIRRGRVILHVDPVIRLMHSRWHTAGHLIGHVAASLGWIPVRAHHWPSDGRVHVSMDGSINNDELSIQDMQKRLDAMISMNMGRTIRMQGSHREVGFGDLPVFACGGTYVATTGEIGKCVITSIADKGLEKSIRYEVVQSVL